jgi:integrase
MNNVKDARGHEIRGLWERNGRYYAQLRLPGKRSPAKVPLVDENNQPVKTPAQAVTARNKLLEDRTKGKAPAPRISPPFDEYVATYLDHIGTTEAKSKDTIARERSSLKHCKKFFGCKRLSDISAGNISDYILHRKRNKDEGGAGDSSRNVNLQIIALRNLFAFAKVKQVLKHELPTRDIELLPYKAAKRTLLPEESIEAVCAEASRTAVAPDVELVLRIQKDYLRKDRSVDWQKAWTEHPEWKATLNANTDKGTQALYSRSAYLLNHPEAAKPQRVYDQGEMLVDWIRLMQYSGARRNAALRARWDHVDWKNRQLHLFTKRNKEVVLTFNLKLEAHLQDMQRRRPVGDDGQLSPYLFPSPRPGKKAGYMHSFQKTLDTVRVAAKFPRFNPHDLRHYFISMCVMAGVDFMTIAEWVGHNDGGVLIGKVYGHLAPGHREAAAKRLNFFFGNQVGNQVPKPAEPTAPAPAMDLTKISAADLLRLLQQAQAGPPLSLPPPSSPP